MTLNKPNAPTAVAAKPEAVIEPAIPNRAEFARLADEWEAGRPRGVDVAQMTAHPAYRRIIAMGAPAVPWILDRLAAKHDHWFVALHAITGANPVAPSDRGNVKAMQAAWREWGKLNGYAYHPPADN